MKLLEADAGFLDHMAGCSEGERFRVGLEQAGKTSADAIVVVALDLAQRDPEPGAPPAILCTPPKCRRCREKDLLEMAHVVETQRPGHNERRTDQEVCDAPGVRSETVAGRSTDLRSLSRVSRRVRGSGR